MHALATFCFSPMFVLVLCLALQGSSFHAVSVAPCSSDFEVLAPLFLWPILSLAQAGRAFWTLLRHRLHRRGSWQGRCQAGTSRLLHSHFTHWGFFIAVMLVIRVTDRQVGYSAMRVGEASSPAAEVLHLDNVPMPDAAPHVPMPVLDTVQQHRSHSRAHPPRHSAAAVASRSARNQSPGTCSPYTLAVPTAAPRPFCPVRTRPRVDVL